jgi:hypothetical protein
MFLQHVSDFTMHFWDRGWPSEHVYSKLLKRGRELEDDPWLGEWLYGRGSLKFMMLPHHDYMKEAIAYRDETDLPVDPWDERKAFYQYAQRFGYRVIMNDYTIATLRFNFNIIQAVLANYKHNFTYIKPLVYTNHEARFTFVGSPRKDEINLPFTDKLGIKLAREFGDNAFSLGWANAGQFDSIVLYNKYVLSCGKEANNWVKNKAIVNEHVQMPSIFYMYGAHTIKAKMNRNFIKMFASNLETGAPISL